MRAVLRPLLLFALLGLVPSLAAQCLKANVSILLDWSGSEKGLESEITLAAYDFCSSLHLSEDQVKVSVSVFNDDGDSTTSNYRTFVDLTDDLDRVTAGIVDLAAYQANGGTLISDALDESVRQLRSDGRPDAYNIIIIISDGIIYDWLEAIYKLYEYRQKMQLNVYCVEMSSPPQLPSSPFLLPSQSQLGSTEKDEGFDILKKLAGSQDRVAIASVQGLVAALKQLDTCL